MAKQIYTPPNVKTKIVEPEPKNDCHRSGLALAFDVGKVLLHCPTTATGPLIAPENL
jgi:hypothetical protein